MNGWFTVADSDIKRDYIPNLTIVMSAVGRRRTRPLCLFDRILKKRIHLCILEPLKAFLWKIIAHKLPTFLRQKIFN